MLSLGDSRRLCRLPVDFIVYPLTEDVTSFLDPKAHKLLTRRHIAHGMWHQETGPGVVLGGSGLQGTPGLRISRSGAQLLMWTDLQLSAADATQGSVSRPEERRAVPQTSSSIIARAVTAPRVVPIQRELCARLSSALSELCPLIAPQQLQDSRASLLHCGQVALVVRNPPAKAGRLRDTGSIPGSGRSPGGRHGNPFQYSSLGNPMGREAWWPAVHGIAQSQTQLKRLSVHAHVQVGKLRLWEVWATGLKSHGQKSQRAQWKSACLTSEPQTTVHSTSRGVCHFTVCWNVYLFLWLSRVWLFVTPWSTRLLCPLNFSSKNTGAGCQSLLQEIFPTQGSKPAFPAFAGEPSGKPAGLYRRIFFF